MIVMHACCYNIDIDDLQVELLNITQWWKFVWECGVAKYVLTQCYI